MPRTINHERHLAIKELLKQNFSTRDIQYQLKCSPGTISEAKKCDCNGGKFGDATATATARATATATEVVASPSPVDGPIDPLMAAIKKYSDSNATKMNQVSLSDLVPLTLKYLQRQYAWCKRNGRPYEAEYLSNCINELCSHVYVEVV